VFLSNRLLNQTSKNVQFERDLVNKLAGEVGENAIRKIQTMLEDVTLSETMFDDFRKSKTTGDNQGLKYQIYVLNESCWPVDKEVFG
jgi:hypothetical protein